jgi:uncharacterized integral membrane protein
VAIRLRAISLIVVVGLLLTFVLQNFSVIDIHFLGWQLRAPMAIICLLVYLLGMLSGWAVMSFVGRSLRSMSER